MSIIWATSSAWSAIILSIIWAIYNTSRRRIRGYIITFSASTVPRVSMWRLSCEVTCRCTKTLRTLVKLKCLRHAGKSLQRTGSWNDIWWCTPSTATKLLLTGRPGWYALEQSLGCARGEEVRATFVTADGKYLWLRRQSLCLVQMQSLWQQWPSLCRILLFSTIFNIQILMLS